MGAILLIIIIAAVALVAGYYAYRLGKEDGRKEEFLSFLEKFFTSEQGATLIISIYEHAEKDVKDGTPGSLDDYLESEEWRKAINDIVPNNDAFREKEPPFIEGIKCFAKRVIDRIGQKSIPGRLERLSDKVGKSIPGGKNPEE